MFETGGIMELGGVELGGIPGPPMDGPGGPAMELGGIPGLGGPPPIFICPIWFVNCKHNEHHTSLCVRSSFFFLLIKL